MAKAAKVLARNKYVLAVVVLGLALLLLPRASDRSGEASAASYAATAGLGDDLASSGIPLDTESRRLEEFLGAIRGVGDARVLLSREGAVVVCAGGGDAGVRLEVTRAVSAYTGLGSDRITVIKMK